MLENDPHRYPRPVTPEAIEALAARFNLQIGPNDQDWDYTSADASPLDDEEIWNTVRSITSEEFGIAPSELHPGIRYVEDLLC
jgi:hypothetical protein